MMTFAEKLKKERKRLDLTQDEAVVLLGVCKRTYVYWESGRLPIAVTQEGALNRLRGCEPCVK